MARLEKFPFFILFFLFLHMNTTSMAKDDIPEPLKPWMKWVLHGQEERLCPFLSYDNHRKYCRWPSKLELHVHDKGGRFVQKWLVFADGWIPLPGDAIHWPQNVKGNDKKVVVAEKKGIPGLYLKKGKYTIAGDFLWDSLPESIKIPEKTGLINLSVNEQAITFPEIDNKSRLFFKKGIQKETTGMDETVQIKVYRRIFDDIPLVMTTRIELDVSGKPREILLGSALIENHVPLSLSSPLPALLEPAGSLRVQLRQGHWSINLKSRSKGPVHSITLKDSEALWPEEEIWVFEAQNHLRMVTITGVAAVDPRQTELPKTWRHLPTYFVHSGDTMNLIQKKRGDPTPPPDQLALERKLWLDFSGKGYTLQDRIQGTKSADWRLQMNPLVQLGRVTINGDSQLITTDQSGHTGIEVRQGKINLVADSRMEGNISRIPTVGWKQNFVKVSAHLNLPPGWRLFDASGSDYISNTWLKKWSLFDLFLLLIISLSFAKLWGVLWGVLAFFTLSLIYHEPGAPHLVWLHLLASSALLHVLPEKYPRFRRAANLYRTISFFLLVIVAFPFMVKQIRQGLYPQLEKPWFSIMEPHQPTLTEEEKIPLKTESPHAKAPKEKRRGRDEPAGKLQQLSKEQDGVGSFSRYRNKMFTQYDPNANIQTGPGLPKWRWNTIHMSWNGPVEQEERIHLILLPPLVNKVLSFFRVILLMIVIVFIGSKFKFPKFKKRIPKETAIFLLPMAMLFSNHAWAEMPSKELLLELRKRLLEKPACFPHCVSSPRMFIKVGPHDMRARMEIHCETDSIVIPLIGHQKQWLPQKVFLNGRPAESLLLSKKGYLLINLPRGIHQVLMEGALPPHDTIQIALPLRPHRVEVEREGWSVEGLHENGSADENLELRRLKKAKEDLSLEGMGRAAFPPFVRVERTVQLGLTWEVETRLIRLSPTGSAIVLEIPLLKGESVTSDTVRVKDGMVQVNMTSHEKMMEWHSIFEKKEQLTLEAPQTLSWIEVWRIDVSPIWHVETAGIPVIHHQSQNGYWLPEWHPWPGEQVSLHVTRPESIQGQTLTVDESLLSVTPGKRAVDVALRIYLRSSRGGQHTIIMPEDVELLSVRIKGKGEPIRQEGQLVTLPLLPGSQDVELLWKHKEGISSYFKTPKLDLGIQSVNAEIQSKIPRDRWILFTGGPSMGPAVLFWGLLVVIGLVSAVLGRIHLTPLKTHHWIFLGVGLSQVPIEIAIVVILWLLFLGWRGKTGNITSNKAFNAIQVLSVFLTIAALIALFYAVKQGLLGQPEMQISGNGSTGYQLRWYQDRVEKNLPQGWIFSVPLKVYRLSMLLWALWMSAALLRWLHWGWGCFSSNGLWRPIRFKKKAEKLPSNKAS